MKAELTVFVERELSRALEIETRVFTKTVELDGELTLADRVDLTGFPEGLTTFKEDVVRLADAFARRLDVSCDSPRLYLMWRIRRSTWAITDRLSQSGWSEICKNS